MLIDIGQYQRLVGKLIYSILCRPDNSYIVRVVSQFMHASTTKHLDAVSRTVQYLKKSRVQGLLYAKQNDLIIEAFTKADWAISVFD